MVSCIVNSCLKEIKENEITDREGEIRFISVMKEKLCAHLSVTIKLLIVGFLSRPSEAEAEFIRTCMCKRESLHCVQPPETLRCFYIYIYSLHSSKMLHIPWAGPKDLAMVIQLVVRVLLGACNSI